MVLKKTADLVGSFVVISPFIVVLALGIGIGYLIWGVQVSQRSLPPSQANFEAARPNPTQGVPPKPDLGKPIPPRPPLRDLSK